VTPKEKKLLRTAIVIVAIYAIPFEIAPRAVQFYRDYREQIDKLKAEIRRYQKLRDDAQVWQDLYQKTVQKRDEINVALLEGNNREIIGARMQNLIKGIAQSTGITFRTLEVAEFSPTKDKQWLLVTQSMQFEAASATLMKFLQALDNAKEDLAVVKLDINSSGGKLNGMIKVTGFSHLPIVENNTENPLPLP